MRFITPDGPSDMEIDQLIIAGWTGRDADSVQHHIDELAALGVAPPSQVPLYYRVSASLLTTADRIEVVGGASSGEAEPMLLSQDGKLWLGLGSDHTDRAMEVASVAASKQACPKPCAAELWPWEEVKDHLDRLTIRSWVHEGGDWVLYQQGTLAKIRPLDELREAGKLGTRAAMMCGTFPAFGGVRPAERFRAVLADPEREREIRLEYETRPLPEVK